MRQSLAILALFLFVLPAGADEADSAGGQFEPPPP